MHGCKITAKQSILTISIGTHLLICIQCFLYILENTYITTKLSQAKYKTRRGRDFTVYV